MTEPTRARKSEAKDYPRLRVLNAYGGVCAWCGSAGPLEIDHIFDDGGLHRKHLGTTTIEAWLCREYRRLGHWPPDFQLLCVSHHRRKTSMQRKAAMASEERENMTISVPKSLAARVRTVAKEPQFGQISQVFITAINQMFAHDLSEEAVRGFQQQLSMMEAKILTTLRDLAGKLPEDGVHLHDERFDSLWSTLQEVRTSQPEVARQLKHHHDNLAVAMHQLLERVPERTDASTPFPWQWLVTGIGLGVGIMYIW